MENQRVLLLEPPVLLFVSQSHEFLENQLLASALDTLAELNCVSLLCSLCCYSLWVVLSL